jgi:hypothetical protein
LTVPGKLTAASIDDKQDVLQSDVRLDISLFFYVHWGCPPILVVQEIVTAEIGPTTRLVAGQHVDDSAATEELDRRYRERLSRLVEREMGERLSRKVGQEPGPEDAVLADLIENLLEGLREPTYGVIGSPCATLDSPTSIALSTARGV